MSNRIIQTVSIIENEKTAPVSNLSINTFTKWERNAMVNRYWQSVDQDGLRRRIFPKEYAELDKIFNSSTQVGVLVTNIHDPESVNVQWIAYPSQMPAVLGENDYCFVVHRKHYDGIIMQFNAAGQSNYEIYGIAGVTLPRTAVFVSVLIGKDEKGEYHLFLQNSYPVSINKSGESIVTAPGGEPTGGIKLP